MSEKLLNIKSLTVIVFLSLASLFLLVSGVLTIYWLYTQAPGSCNVAEVDVYGPIVYYDNESLGNASLSGQIDETASEDVRREIENADADSSIKAILVQIDSPGGDPVAGETIADALKHATKPTVALVGDEGTSAAYWAATGAQTIFASANSELIDIGVTESYLQQTKQDQNNGLEFEALTAGKYKDTGNPDSPLTPEERALLLRDLNITDENFIADVAANRNLSVASVTTIADGSAMLGEMAMNDGLIDKIGDIYDVESFLQKKLGTHATVCGQ